MKLQQVFRNITTKGLFLGLASGVMMAEAQEQTAWEYDARQDKAYSAIMIPFVVPAIYQTVSPTASDAPLVLRLTALLTNAWFDAIAPYHPTAIGVYSDLGRRPEAERADNERMNIATLYASYHVLNSLLPEHAEEWREMMAAAGLDPDDSQENTSTPQGIGNLAGKAIVAAREHDGMNQLGNEGGHKYNPRPYADYLGYEPVNTPHKLNDPSRWQPAIQRIGMGLYKAQEFVTPQLRVTEPYSYKDPSRFRASFPKNSQTHNLHRYRAQADEVLLASANLSGEQKMKGELFDDKLLSLATSGEFAIEQAGLGLAESIHYEFLTNMAAFDTAIALWDNKYRYDAVRPFSAIAYLYGDAPITAWGGPGLGTVADLPASQWASYLPVADHPEYPSGSAGFCSAHAETSRLFLNSDRLDWSVPVAQGSSRIEPGHTPGSDMVLHFNTWSEFEHDCGQSRLWGGVHFQAAIAEGHKIGHKVARTAYRFVQDHVSGKAASKTNQGKSFNSKR